MDANAARLRIEALAAALTAHNIAYYSGAPTIADAEFDAMLQELQQLEAQYPQYVSTTSPTNKVGTAPTGTEFEEIQHIVPMLSVDNVFTPEELTAFHHAVAQTVAEPRYSVDYKVDGMALAAWYVDGKLSAALTRGDGLVGQFVLPQAMTIRNLPLQLEPLRYAPRGLFEVRGEVYIGNTAFAKYQQECLSRGDALPANPRNAATGAMRQKDSRITRERPLQFVAHSYGRVEHVVGGSMFTHEAIMEICQRHGIPTVPLRGSNLPYAAMLEHVDYLIAEAPTCDLPIDGIVVKLESQHHREALGQGNKYVKWAAAYKWERYEAETILRDITIQVGKHGNLTPVAELSPVTIAGTTVSRASLFNQDEIDRLGVGIGAKVLVEKAGKIIPHIVRVVPDPAIAFVPYQIPAVCPACRSEAIREGSAMLCVNPSCPSQLVASLCSAVSKSHLDIAGMGPTMVERLVTAGALACIADLYTVDQKEAAIVAIPGISDGKYRRIRDSIASSKQLPSWKQLASWGIRHCGTTTSESLLRKLGSIDVLAGMPVDALLALPGIGPVAAESIAAFFSSEAGQHMLAVARAAGVNLGEHDPKSTIGERPLEGLRIVPSGEFRRWDREAIKTVIREHGGLPGSSVSAKTALLVVGEAPGPVKLQKAAALGVRVLSEGEFVALLETGVLPPQ